MLVKYGHDGEAREQALKLQTSGLCLDQRVELLTIEAMIVCRRGERAIANGLIAKASSLAEGSGDNTVLLRRVAMAAAFIAYDQGLYESALEQCERAIRPWFSKILTGEEAIVFARELIFLGMVHQEGGSPKRALAVLNAAEELLQHRCDPPISDLADLHVQRAWARASFPDRLTEAQRDVAEAERLASKHGLTGEYVWAKLASGVLHELTGKPSEAYADIRQALSLGCSVLSGDPLARTHFISSRVEIYANELEDTLPRLQSARALVRSDSLMGTIVDLVEARVHRARHDAPATISAATAAIEGFERRNTSTHYLGQAYLVRAMASDALGLDAREDANAAVSLLARGGWISDQTRAAEIAARAARTYRC